MTRITDRLASERGTAMVEFALILPILLVLALGIVDFGRAMNYWNDVNQIAADGARFAAVNRNPGADVSPPVGDFREWLRGQAVTGELRDRVVAGGTAAHCEANPNDAELCSQSVGNRLKVCINSPTGQPLTTGNPIRVEVRSSYNAIPFLAEEAELGSMAIRGEAVMRLEQNYTGPTGCLP
jgi:hypothetical protein